MHPINPERVGQRFESSLVHLKQKMNITTKEVKTLNATSGYIQMPKSEVGKEFLVLTQKELEFLLGRKLEEDKDFKEAMENRED